MFTFIFYSFSYGKFLPVQLVREKMAYGLEKKKKTIPINKIYYPYIKSNGIHEKAPRNTKL